MRTLRDRLRRRDDDGFTIAEVLVALMVFAIMSTGSIWATISMLQITRDARNRQVAANLAAQEIDAVRAYADTTAVVDRAFNPPAQNGTSFHVARTVGWQSIPVGDQADGACTMGQQRYLADVTVTVTWAGMRSGTSPAVSSTLLTARDVVLNPNAGIILATVRGSDGSGREGVRVTSGGVASVSNAQGCAVLFNVPAGTHDVSATRSGYVDQSSSPAPKKSTGVTAGGVTQVGFQLDAATTTTVYYAASYVADYGARPYPLLPGVSPAPPAGTATRAFASLPVTFTNSNVDNVETVLAATPTMVGSTRLFPFASGYSVFAGDCDQADPKHWYPDGRAATTPVATPAGGQAQVYVPMGVVLLAVPGGTATVVATPNGATGCSASTYTFGSADGFTVGGTVALALPYGSWTLAYSNDPAQPATNPVAAGSLTPTSLPARPGLGLPAVTCTTSGAVITCQPVVP